MLGPSVGAVVNDVSADLAGGRDQAGGSGRGRAAGLAARQLTRLTAEGRGAAALPVTREVRAWRRPVRLRPRGPPSRHQPGCASLGRSAGTTAVVLLFLPPALFLFTLFVALPMGEAAWYSFYNWNGYGSPTDFVGWRNFELLFANRAFRIALINNLLIIVVSLAVQLPLALAMAVLLADRMRGTGDVPADLLPALHPRRDRRRSDLALRLRRRVRPRREDLGTLRGRAAPRARRARPRDVRHPGRRRLEVFRLPHDAVHRGPPADRPQPLRGGAHRRRDRLADLQAHHGAAARVRRSGSRCSSPSWDRSSCSTSSCR